MYKLRITKAGMTTYTGMLGPVKFKDGVSTEAVTERFADRVAAAVSCEYIDKDGDSVHPAGIAYRLVGGATTKMEVSPTMRTATDEEVADEKEREAIKRGKSPVDAFYTADDLRSIADEKGIHGLREIGNKWQVRDRAIPGLMREILKAQLEFRERVAAVARVPIERVGPRGVIAESDVIPSTEMK